MRWGTNSSGGTPLRVAAAYGHAETVQMLLHKGFRPNNHMDKGLSPLGAAVVNGYDDVVKVLLDGGASIDHGQPSAIHCAVLLKRYSILKLFEQKKVKNEIEELTAKTAAM
jgi:ankyrin repeat protein